MGGQEKAGEQDAGLTSMKGGGGEDRARRASGQQELCRKPALRGPRDCLKLPGNHMALGCKLGRFWRHGSCELSATCTSRSRFSPEGRSEQDTSRAAKAGS